MYVTQPRRIAAIAAAERVSQVQPSYYSLLVFVMAIFVQYLVG